MIGNYSLDLILFYVSVFATLALMFQRKTRQPLLGLAISVLIVLVGSEYYEIPIFVLAYLGIRGSFPHVLHHVITTVLFIMLISICHIQLTKRNVSLLFLGPLATTPLLLCFQWAYPARLIGLTVLTTVAFNSPGVGGSKSSRP